MSLATTGARYQYTSDGLTNLYPFPAVFIAPADILVDLRDPTGTLVGTVLNGGGPYGYTVGGVQDAASGEYLAGGSVVFGAVLPSGWTVTLFRDPPQTQTVALQSGAKFPAETINTQFDKLTMLDQAMLDRYGRTLQGPVGDGVGLSMVLPAAKKRASQLLGFDPSGQPMLYLPNQPTMGPNETWTDLLWGGRLKLVTMTGPVVSGPAAAYGGYNPSGEMLDITDNAASASDDFLIAYRIRHVFGGSAARGGRNAFFAALWHQNGPTNAANTNRNYCAIQGSTIAVNGDGGTGGSPLGQYFGGGLAVYLPAGAAHVLNGTGAELNSFTAAGSSVSQLSQLALVGCNAVRGSFADCALDISAQPAVGGYGPHIGFKYGILFNNYHGGTQPFTTDGVLLAAFSSVGVPQLTSAIDVSGYVFSDSLVKAWDGTALKQGSLFIAGNGASPAATVAATPTTLSGAAAVNLLLAAYGNAEVDLQANGRLAFSAMSNTSNPTNYPTALAQAAGAPAVLGALGTDTDIDLLLQGKGAGLVRFGTYTNTALANAGYITIKDSGGTSRRLAVV